MFIVSYAGNLCNLFVNTNYAGNPCNLFVNTDAILNRDALWFIQGKNTIYKRLLLEEYTDERLLSYNQDMSIMFAISLHAWRNEFLMNDEFHSDLFIFPGSSLFY